MALFEIAVTATPMNISALLGVSAGSSFSARAKNMGQSAIYRAVSDAAPANLDGAVWRYNPGESFTMTVHAGAIDGNTWLIAASGSVRVILENNIPA